jgi:hypothetical protein
MSDEPPGIEPQSVAFSWERATRLHEELRGYAEQLVARAPRHDAEPYDRSTSGLQ